MLYGAIIKARNVLYDKGAFKSSSLGVPTVSIGNITVGGTGKTPLVAFVAEILAAQGEKVCILTRGYGRENAKQRVLVSDSEQILAQPNKAGDEPFELAQKLLGKTVVVADANRVAAGNWARKQFGITAFVLDDGFQHRKIKRELDIVLVDATNPFGNGKLLPSGILREPLAHLKRADAIVITRANLVDNLDNLKSQISDFSQNCSIFVSENKVANLVNLKEFHAEAQSSQSTTDKEQKTKDKGLAFCALGNPNNFFEQLRREDFDLVSTEIFPDHHFYTPKDVAKIERKANETGAKILLTTAKDAVKLKDKDFNLPCFVVESELVFDDEIGFRNLLITVIEK
ncbi:MAG: tetraacyldisaccharide 4'-kinase [Acidobacteriota bacterium]|jgi:tetraacyldisaccharide 4'-kinase|nr:tetraacyldisaccharide 4'-kinase [Acidobacteriota bacterium]